MKCGAYDFLPKPFLPDELRLIVNRGLERRRLGLESQRHEVERAMLTRRFVTFVAHQLRTPLVAVHQYLNVMKHLDQSPAKEHERKEEMKPIHRTLRALRPTEDLIEGLAGIKGLTRSDLPERRLGAANTLTGPKGCCRQSWGSERPDCSLLTNRT